MQAFPRAAQKIARERRAFSFGFFDILESDQHCINEAQGRYDQKEKDENLHGFRLDLRKLLRYRLGAILRNGITTPKQINHE